MATESHFPPIFQFHPQNKLQNPLRTFFEHKNSRASSQPRNGSNTNTKSIISSKPTKPISLLSMPKGLTTSIPSPITGTAVAGAIFAALSTANPAFAAQQLAEIADGDNRGIALLIPLVPAILWVLYNILQPALNQINKMRSTKGVIIGLGLGLGGLAVSGFLHPSEASAGEIAAVAEAAADNRGQLLLFVVAPAIAWVLYNILQPALNQINRMRSIQKHNLQQRVKSSAINFLCKISFLYCMRL